VTTETVFSVNIDNGEFFLTPAAGWQVLVGAQGERHA
jgi:hypothetical protein